ncbi:ribosomal-protein-S18p-alanine acetyltransferase [Vibrio maritimus]|uniref:Ribosomal-protein-S18p-alanine acetyltransferase n=1 Tax=Vibrio maritimus TaxID=990268 RepID=A0A090TXV1_9VIBR|nr:ribosomal-protein-S18p-alanine acetyltransferase [Vibrio maritimus]
MKYRKYTVKDRDALVAILQSNCPKYFIESDKADLLHFLDNYADENYLVAESEGRVVGCGGHYTKDFLHGIAWVMFERKAIGHKMLLSVADSFYSEIEKRIKAEGHMYDIQISTTQLMEKLFGRYGFKTMAIVNDGFGKGLHQYDMVKSFVSGDQLA